MPASTSGMAAHAQLGLQEDRRAEALRPLRPAAAPLPESEEARVSATPARVGMIISNQMLSFWLRRSANSKDRPLFTSFIRGFLLAVRQLLRFDEAKF